MKTSNRMIATTAAALLLAVPATLALAWQDQPAGTDAELTEDGVITGTMNIEFGTRTNLDRSGDLKEGSPAIGAQDKYTFTFNVAKTTEFSGDITRQPNLYSKIIRSRKQEAQLAFNINLAVLNPRDLKQKRNVGKWVGLVPIDTASGAFELAGGAAKERPLRIAIDTVGTAKGFIEPFSGRLVGKAEEKTNLASYTYKRLVGDKTVTVTAKQVDPMRFEGLVLAKGPAEIYPRTTVNGRLDYDYETGNWFTDGIRFNYSLDGKEYEDVITGSIKWIEDPNREANGKGYYEFNLRFNEEKNAKSSDESSAFTGMSDEEAFFFVDNTIPAMTGKIEYQDTMISGSDAPSSSKVTYNLNANKLTKQQVMNFFKLWTLCIGPTNDE